ncbi:MAG: hypothetical protein MUE44_28580 [Oscillatoriaceae cyanobacterium Prado104]|nr:hypothetical protein [Oscillatoriaceae cyanobacterium Prado104]
MLSIQHKGLNRSCQEAKPSRSPVSIERPTAASAAPQRPTHLTNLDCIRVDRSPDCQLEVVRGRGFKIDPPIRRLGPWNEPSVSLRSTQPTAGIMLDDRDRNPLTNISIEQRYCCIPNK